MRVFAALVLAIVALSVAWPSRADERPNILPASLVFKAEGAVAFQFEATPGDTRMFQVLSAEALDPDTVWTPISEATITESAPGLFQVEISATNTAARRFYRLLASAPPAARLQISEVMSDNTSVFPDANKAYWDWIEIHNPTDGAVDLEGYGLTDETPQAGQWTFPQLLLQPGAYLVAYASGLDRRLPGSELHTDFKLDASGETLSLTAPDLSIVDQVVVPPLGKNESYGRVPNDTSVWELYAQALVTPGQANSATTSGPALSAPEFPAGSQFLAAGTVLPITLQTSTTGSSIRFTLNGYPVTTNATLYTGPLALSNTVVIRTRSFLGARSSQESIRTYFFGVTHDLPVVSLAAPATNFAFKDGYLFGMGTNVLSSSGQVLDTYPFSKSHAWMNREIEAAIEFFETDHEAKFRQRVGMSVFGGWGSRGYPQKSVALFARASYGEGSMKHQIFPDRDIDRFESIVLRNSGNDNQSTHQTAPRPPITEFGQTYSYGSYFVNGNFTLMRDAMMQRLLDGTTLDTQACRPAVVYLNGEYWGIYNLREKINEDYVLANHGFAQGEVDVIEAYGTVMAGDSTRYTAMRSFISSKDLKVAANYDTVATQYLDIDNFIDYHLAVIYFQNFDIGNIKCWRPRVGDGRFRWIVYDQDYGFNLWPPAIYIPAMARDYADYDNMFEFYTASTGTGTGWPNAGGRTLLLRRMLLNDGFKARFIRRCADLLNTQFEGNHVAATIGAMAAVIRPEMARHLERWSWVELQKRGYGRPYKPEYSPFTLATWETNLTVLTDFARKRPAKLRQDCTNYFALTKGLAEVAADVAPLGSGRIRSGAATVSAFPWEGTFFRDYPPELVAIPRVGYRFVEWTGAGTTTNIVGRNLSQLDATNTVVAHFEAIPQTVPSNPTVFVTEVHYHPGSQEESGDWIELHNSGSSAVKVTGWILRDDDDNHEYVLPEATIAANGYLVLCEDVLRFRRIHPSVTNCVGNFSFGLNNSGDSIRLFEPAGAPVLKLDYDDALPWPAEADGTGYSLQLTDSTHFSSSASDWRASPTVGGSPGRANP
jgi:hypothetical protein